MPRYRTVRPKRDSGSSRVLIGRDDQSVFIVRRDYSGGQNNRQHPSQIAENQGRVIQNCDISVPGQVSRRPGRTLLEDLGANAIQSLFGYDPQGGTPNLLAVEGTNLKRWPTTGSFSSVYTTLTSGIFAKIIKAYKTGVGDVALISNGTDNVLEMTPSYGTNDLGDTNTSPPKTTVMTTYRNRVWGLKNDLLYYSSASPSDYSTAFDRTTNYYRVPVGEERAVVGVRDTGLVIVGKEQVWGLNPSVVPAATDKPEKLLDNGCAASETFQQLGDDFLYLSFDGVRSLQRSIQDKLQGGGLPLSYVLKDEFDSISWGSITKACAVVWQNKYLIALPINGSSYNNSVWVYFPATQSWSVFTGWNVSSWAKIKVSGQDRLYYGEASADGKVYRAWSGSDDSGTAVSFSIEGRNEDLGYPIAKKSGGEVKVVAKPTGNYDISVSISFDGGSYNLLGTLNVGTNLVTFPTTFPVTFYPDQLVYKKFHLDSYGPWYQARIKMTNSDITTNSDDITIYEVSLSSILEEYISEEEV